MWILILLLFFRGTVLQSKRLAFYGHLERMALIKISEDESDVITKHCNWVCWLGKDNSRSPI
jgi:hypothetical protein